jgi:hypothetical protein
LPFKKAKTQEGLLKLAAKLSNLNDHLSDKTKRSDFQNIETILSPVLTKLKNQNLDIIDLQVPSSQVDEAFSTLQLHMDHIIEHGLVSDSTFFEPDALDLIYSVGNTGQSAVLNLFTQAVKRGMNN